MRIFIRADASERIGTGHVMRCLTLADQIIKHNSKIEFVFLYRTMPEHLHKVIINKNFVSLKIQSFYEVGSLEDAGYVVDKIATHFKICESDWLIIDHYQIDSIWESAMGKLIRNILVIDDLANRMHQCTVLLDSNLYANYESRYDQRVPHTTLQLLGPKFALLREEFLLTRNSLPQRDSGTIQNVLICFGGTDPTNETFKVLSALEPLLNGLFKFTITTVVGKANSNVNQIQNMCESIPGALLLVQPESMAMEMAKSDLAICSGGTLTWERYCMGLPGVTIAVADNQIEVAKTGHDMGIDLFLGESKSVLEKDIRSAFLKLLNDSERVRKASKLAMDVIDGRGTGRVAQLLFPK